MEEQLDEKIEEVKTDKSGSKQIAGAILLAGILIAGAVLLRGNRPPEAPARVVDNGANIKINLAPLSPEDHILGNQDSKIVIVEYSDLECPFCKVFHKTMLEVTKSNNDVAWVYRHYPISSLHAKAFKEAEATECAFEQGGNTAFWQYTNTIFEITTSNDGLDASELPKIATSMGLNVNTFNACLESGKYTAKVQAQMDSGDAAGVTGTPKAFILRDGKVVDTIDGAEPISMVKTKINAALK